LGLIYGKSWLICPYDRPLSQHKGIAMTEIKFNPKKLKKLNDPQRLKDIPPEVIQKELGLDQAEVLVDLGAGTAFFSLALLRQFQAKTVYACDLSEGMLSWIRENIADQHPAVVPILSGESSVPLEDGIADLVFMITLHHELETPMPSLAESLRLLKPGGTILIVDWLKKQMDQGPPAEIRCTPEQVKGQLAQTGFSPVRIHDNLAKHFMVTASKP